MLQSKLNEYGEVVNCWVEPIKAEPEKKTSKNAKRKAKRYGKRNKQPVKLTAYASFTKDSSGAKYEFSRLFHARRQCQSPELILIRQGY